ncbi:hypothetical protein [Hymenobacter sp. PAMC 26628]|uniref:hypothetical protein n=1 Tax=Hymenobacter sp. PAMC 26628 TaxID=1484118 RepID=UPI0007701626|nr:hypothetical protein [Hymenobacter sp. PAMC 26628]AMJ67123.1 hypothetical protein AXW84_18085 [Hymenobacter sp. PAMC 26628]
MNPAVTTSTNTSAPASLPDGGPDCERVNTVLDQLAEGQVITAEDEDFLYDHGTDCSPCFDGIEKQHVFIEFLNLRVGRKSTPAGLSQSIMARVHVEMA